MASKALVLLGLFAFLLVVSEVAAASDTVESGSEKTVQLDHYGHGGHGGGCVGQGETGGGRCPHGCCRWFHNRCVRCCRDAGEAVQTQPDTVESRSEETVQLDHYGHGGNGGYNEGGSEGQGQRCGGCGRNRCCRCIGGRCFRCCHAGEANQTQPDTVDSGSEKTVQPDQYGHDSNKGYSEGGSEEQGQRCGGCGRNRCCRCIGGRCLRCCHAGEAIQTQPDTVDSGSEVTVQLDHYGHGSNGGYNERGHEGQGKMDGCLHGCNHGCCSCVRGRCVRCCSHAGEAVQTQPDTVESGSEKTVQPYHYGHGGNGGYNEGGSEGQGQICGGCGRNRCCRCIGGRCFRCCHAGEANQTQPDTVDSGSEKTVQPDQYGQDGNEGYNEGGSEGQGQRCGGCGRNRCCRCIGGRCFRCCHAGEAVQTQPDTVDSGSEKTVQHDQYGHDGNEGYNEGDSEGQGQICGGCGRHRCCRCIGGRCVRCCRDAGEAVIASSLGIEYL